MSEHDKLRMPFKRQRTVARWKTLFAACLTVPLLASCAVTGRVTETSCFWTKPFRVSKADILTEDLAGALLTHNRLRAQRCK